MAKAQATPNEIIGFAGVGLVLQIDGGEVVAPWSAILTVSVVMALVDRTSDRRIPVLVLGVMTGADERIFIVGSSDPVWEPLASTLPEVLPGMPPFEVWGVELAASGKASLRPRPFARTRAPTSDACTGDAMTSAPLELYERGAGT